MEWRSRQDGRVSTVSPATPTTDNGAAEKHGNAATATSGGTATAEGRRSQTDGGAYHHVHHDDGQARTAHLHLPANRHS